MKQKNSISIIVISLIPICLAINVVGGNLASALKIPLYVDSIGTILIGMLCGPAIGCLTGALTGVVSGIFSPIMFAYIPVTAIYGLAAGFLSKKKMMTSIPKLITSGIIIALLGVVLSSPITALVFGGITETGARRNYNIPSRNRTRSAPGNIDFVVLYRIFGQAAFVCRLLHHRKGNVKQISQQIQIRSHLS